MSDRVVRPGNGREQSGDERSASSSGVPWRASGATWREQSDNETTDRGTGQILVPMNATQRWQKVAELNESLPPSVRS